MNAAYLTDEDVDFEKLEVEAKAVLEKAPWKLTYRKGSHSKKLCSWIYFGELQPKLVKEGVYGLLVAIDVPLDDEIDYPMYEIMHGVFDKGMMKG